MDTGIFLFREIKELQSVEFDGLRSLSEFVQ